jgi:hypothetical protein
VIPQVPTRVRPPAPEDTPSLSASLARIQSTPDTPVAAVSDAAGHERSVSLSNFFKHVEQFRLVSLLLTTTSLLPITRIEWISRNLTV